MKMTPIQPSEVEILRDLAMRTYSAAFAHKNARGVLEKYYEIAFAKAELLRQLHHPESYWYFALEGDDIIGYIKLNSGSAQTEYQHPEGLEIERIYIDVPYIGLGYGSHCLKFAISGAKELEKNYIWLGVWQENPAAIRFYKKHHFKIVGTHEYDMIAETQTDYIMRRDL